MQKRTFQQDAVLAVGIPLDPLEALELLTQIQRVLWLEDGAWNRDKEWSADTAQEVADVLEKLRP